jgi:hypothetical protein
LDAAKRALGAAGFIHRQVAGMDIFLDGLNARARDAVHVVFAGEKILPEYAEPAPDVNDSERPDQFRVVSLESLVRMKLTSYRRKDQVHLLDMLDAGLIDASWTGRLPADLSVRLQTLIDTPEG